MAKLKLINKPEALELSFIEGIYLKPVPMKEAMALEAELSSGETEFNPEVVTKVFSKYLVDEKGESFDEFADYDNYGSLMTGGQIVEVLTKVFSKVMEVPSQGK